MHPDPDEFDPDASPVNPLPPVVVALALFIFGIEVIFLFGTKGYLGGREAVGWRLATQQDFAVFPGLVSAMIDAGQYPLEHLRRLVTYLFFHIGFTQMIFAFALLLALGKMVAEAFGAVAFLTIFFLSGIVGGAVFSELTTGSHAMIGAFPAVYGLIGAYTFILWVSYGQIGAPQVRAFTLIGFLLGIQLIFGVLFGTGQDWIGDVAGFVAGFFLSFVVSPGGWGRLLDKLRQR